MLYNKRYAWSIMEKYLHRITFHQIFLNKGTLCMMIRFIICQRWQWWCCTSADIFWVKNNHWQFFYIPSYHISVHSTSIQFTTITFTKYNTYIQFWLAGMNYTVQVIWQGGCFQDSYTGSYTQSQSHDILQPYMQWLILLIKTRNSSS